LQSDPICIACIKKSNNKIFLLCTFFSSSLYEPVIAIIP
jgi:hypothetical protein